MTAAELAKEADRIVSDKEADLLELELFRVRDRNYHFRQFSKATFIAHRQTKTKLKILPRQISTFLTF